MRNSCTKRANSIGSAGMSAGSLVSSSTTGTPSPLTPCLHTSSGSLPIVKPLAAITAGTLTSSCRSYRGAATATMAPPTSGCSMISRPGNRAHLRDANPRPLAEKHIYLDLMPAMQKAIESKLCILGANIEKCLSKDASYMITDRGQPNDYRTKSRKPLKCLAECPSPNIPVNSSPLTPRQASSTLSTVSPLSRGQAIASLANTTKYQGGGNAVVSAQRMGIKIIHLESALNYINKELEKVNLMTNAVSSPSQHSKPIVISAKKLPFPVCKISSKLYQPIIISAKYFTSSIKTYNRTISKQKSKQSKVVNNYCELCNDEFTILSKHLKSKEHSSKVNQPKHFAELDLALEKCGTLADLIANFS